MAEYDNNMSGALFTNDKDGNDKRPDRKGFCEIDGKEYWVSGWIKTAKQGKHEGEKFLSLAFQAKEEQSEKKADKDEW